MSAEQARQEATRRMGSQIMLRESSRDIKVIPWLASIVQDFAFGLRLLRKNPAVTAAALLSLSLAIGACTAAFSLIDALILRPLPVNDPQRLVYLTFTLQGARAAEGTAFNYPLFERMRDASRLQVRLFGMSHQTRREATFDDSAGRTERIYAQWISGDAFSILGVKPALGRLLTAADDQTPGQHPVAVLSYDLWSRRFNSDPRVVGRWLILEAKQFQIVGVMEKHFTGAEPGYMTDVWVPNMMWRQEALSSSDWSWFRIFGALRPGVSSDQARAVLQTVFTNFRRDRDSQFGDIQPRTRIEQYINTPLHVRSAANGPSDLRREFERPLWILGLIALLVLLIACSNVASLLIARAAARDREMALRISIGAGRGRLIQQVLVESAILSLASCLLGVLIAKKAAPLIIGALSTSQTIVRLDLHVDWRVFAFLAASGALTTFLFGLAPAFRATAVAPAETLKSGSARQSVRVKVFRPLVAAQTSFSFIVLFIAGLFLTSFAKLVRTDPGFDPNHLAVVDVEAKELKPGDPKSLAAWNQLLDRLREVRGIQSASLSGWSIFSGSGQSLHVQIAGRAVEAFEPYFLPVSPAFLKTMGIPLVDGRDFATRDAQVESPTAVIVNENFARRYFPRESALGKRFFKIHGFSTLVPQEIVGIAGNAKYNSLREPTPPTVYYPIQLEGWASLQIRTMLDPPALAALLRNEIPRVHPAFRMIDITLQSTLVENTIVQARLLALLAGFFATVAVILAAVGLYGVLNYSVVQRTREIGIRIALGARPIRVVGLVASEVATVTCMGLGAGVAGGVFASRFVTTLLYEVKPSGFWTVAGPLMLLLVTCVGSCLPPALRATRLDPVTALRYE